MEGVENGPIHNTSNGSGLKSALLCSTEQSSELPVTTPKQLDDNSSKQPFVKT